jgi:hypothetical protein
VEGFAWCLDDNVEMGEHVTKKILNVDPFMLQAMCCYQTSMLLLATGSQCKYSAVEEG